MQGNAIVTQPLVIAMLAVPILVQVLFNSSLAYWLNRRLGVVHCVAAPSALIGASNFFDLAVATAISLFGFQPGATLATVVGVLIEVPVMLPVVKIANATHDWYEYCQNRKAFHVLSNITVLFLKNSAYTLPATLEAPFTDREEKMITDKTEVTAKKTSNTKAPAVEKMAAKPVVKPAAKKIEAMPKLAAKKPKKEPKVKVVRDFSIPQIEYKKIAEIKEACLKAGLHVKKNEVLRAGLKVLGEMNEAQQKRVIVGLAKIKIGRPKKP